jgi:uncharacterized membrane protein YhdT
MFRFIIESYFYIQYVNAYLMPTFHLCYKDREWYFTMFSTWFQFATLYAPMRFRKILYFVKYAFHCIYTYDFFKY